MTDRREWTPEIALHDMDWSLPIRLLKARELVMQAFRPHLRLHGLTEQQWRVIRVLAESGGLEMQALSGRCHILLPSLSRTVPILEQRQLVSRNERSANHRRGTVKLTGAGRTLFETVARGSEPIYAAIRDQLGLQTIAQVFEALDALISKLDRNSTEPFSRRTSASP